LDAANRLRDQRNFSAGSATSAAFPLRTQRLKAFSGFRSRRPNDVVHPKSNPISSATSAAFPLRTQRLKAFSGFRSRKPHDVVQPKSSPISLRDLCGFSFASSAVKSFFWLSCQEAKRRRSPQEQPNFPPRPLRHFLLRTQRLKAFSGFPSRKPNDVVQPKSSPIFLRDLGGISFANSPVKSFFWFSFQEAKRRRSPQEQPNFPLRPRRHFLGELPG
jgi:hypothetical protein